MNPASIQRTTIAKLNTGVKVSEMAVRPHVNKRITSHDFLRPPKKQKALRWSPEDQQKFRDALRVFGENIELIHQLVFSKDARQRYEYPERDFSERSQVQLRNKFKELDDLEDDDEKSISWFEQTYKVRIKEAA